MNSSRARNIIDSPDSVEVLYNGTPVWLESVSSDNLVEITNLKTRTRDTVPVNQLIENNK